MAAAAPQGLDRPVDRAVRDRRSAARAGAGSRQDSDLGLAMLWKVDDDGRHTVRWEIPLDATRGTYRFVVTAKRYRLASRTLPGARHAAPWRSCRCPRGPGAWRWGCEYPGAVRDVDLTHRPQYARGGVVRFRVGQPHGARDGAAAGASSR